MWIKNPALFPICYDLEEVRRRILPLDSDFDGCLHSLFVVLPGPHKRSCETCFLSSSFLPFSVLSIFVKCTLLL